MSFLMREAAAGRTRLHVALTNSLPFDFVQRTVLRVAQAVFASCDELAKITGWHFKPTPEGATDAALRLHRISSGAIVYLTLGEEGVIVVEAGSGRVWHVHLHLRSRDEVQQFVRSHSTQLCGAGDAFAGGTVAFLECLKPLVSGINGRYPHAVSASIAGCATAVQWIGWEQRLSAPDFVVKTVARAAA